MDELTSDVLKLVFFQQPSLLSDLRIVQQLLQVSKSMQSIVQQEGLGQTGIQLRVCSCEPLKSHVTGAAGWLATHPRLVGTINGWNYDFLGHDVYEKDNFRRYPTSLTYAEIMGIGLAQAAIASRASNSPSGCEGQKAWLPLRTFNFDALATSSLLSTLQYAQQLTELRVHVLTDSATASAIGQLSRLRTLQMLGMGEMEGVMKPVFTAEVLSGLSSLTHLSIGMVDDDFDSSHLPQTLQELTLRCLAHLKHGCTVSVGSSPQLRLRRLTALTSLEVWGWDGPVVAELSTQLKSLTLDLCDNAEQILTTLNISELRQLQFLEMTWMSEYSGVYRHPEALDELSGLTCLQSVSVDRVTAASFTASWAVWSTLPKLTQLCVDLANLEMNNMWKWLRCVAAATGLKELSLVRPDPHDGDSASAASQLATPLCAQLAGLTSLKELCLIWYFGDDLITIGVNQLSTLTELTHLSLEGLPGKEVVDWHVLFTCCKNLQQLHLLFEYPPCVDWPRPLASCITKLAELEALTLSPVSAEVADDFKHHLLVMTKLTTVQLAADLDQALETVCQASKHT